MEDIFDLGLLPAFVLVAGVIAVIAATFWWGFILPSRRKTASVDRIASASPTYDFHATWDGSVHAVPLGQRHDDSDRCFCGPWSKDLGILLVQHRDLKAARR